MADRPEGTPQSSSAPAAKPFDWRLIAIVAVAVLFIAAYAINRKFYGSKDLQAPPPEQAAGQPEEKLPALPPAEQYAMLIKQCEAEAMQAVFSAGGRDYILAAPPMPEDAKAEIPVVNPGRLFDVTQRLEGLRPAMLFRRVIFGSDRIAFINTYPALNYDARIRTVIKAASEIAPDALPGDARVNGVLVGEQARAYPTHMANYHDVINDTLGEKPIVVAWSAIANAALAFEAPLRDGKPLTFGSSGLIYQCAIVMFDQETFSLWSPTLGKAIAGEMTGTPLAPIHLVRSNWQMWKAAHPQTTVLAGTDPVLPINYERNPATPPDYGSGSALLYPVYGVGLDDTPVWLKDFVYGVIAPDGQSAKAYPLRLLDERFKAETAAATPATLPERVTAPSAIDSSAPSETAAAPVAASEVVIEDDIDGVKVRVTFNGRTGLLTAVTAEGQSLISQGMYWMAWKGAHPKTGLWQEERLVDEQARLRARAASTTTLPSPADLPPQE